MTHSITSEDISHPEKIENMTLNNTLSHTSTNDFDVRQRQYTIEQRMNINSPSIININRSYKMKVQFKSLTKTSVWLIILMPVLFTLGCSNNNDTENQNTQVNKDTSTVDAVSKKPKPPEIDIHSAAVSGNAEAIKQHILAGTNLDLKDPFGGSSPMISAALFGEMEIVSLLVEAGADINFLNNEGSTALHTAAFFCRPEIVRILLDNGIDKNVRNNMGSTAYESVAGTFKDVKPFYDMIGQSLSPYGLVLDYDDLQKTRPIIAEMLK